jgi:hypothetical protein
MFVGLMCGVMVAYISFVGRVPIAARSGMSCVWRNHTITVI